MKKENTKQKVFDPKKNYEQTKKEIGYVPLKKAKEEDYQRIGFLSGLEVHQQLKTDEKLFCRCPAGIYHENKNYDAEIIRHMRPTLSEMGEYDGTALMEFRTRKNITYQINNQTCCTYDIDDTPPFPINRQALEYAIEISMLSKLNIVGEVHITRKQYLDGSIPAGFQRTAIIGVNGEIQLKNKKVKLIQLSLEEDSCREISDIGHERVYKTDRLGVPLIETVTAPELYTPYELREAAEYIRFLNRSTGKVRVGIGSGREDVNVSCKGGTRVEIKGVAHNKWIPALSHNEAFRQWALLNIKEKLNKLIPADKWKINSVEIDEHLFPSAEALKENKPKQKLKFIAVNLPGFKGILSHFTQPGKSFADEIADRLKVIACIEKPNLICSEDLYYKLSAEELNKITELLKSGNEDAQLLICSSEEDLKTALETIEERCLMAFEGVPQETRKSFQNGTTIFERVLPGADRMYPDTDSAPIPLEAEYIENLMQKLPTDVSERYVQLKNWGIPEDTYFYILRNNLVPLIEKTIELNVPAKYIGTFLGHTLKNIEGKSKAHINFSYELIYKLFKFIKNEKLEADISKVMLPVLYQYPSMEFKSILTSINFKRRLKNEILAPVDYLIEKFKEIRKSKHENVVADWIMGQLHSQAIGNISLKELKDAIDNKINEFKN